MSFLLGLSRAVPSTGKSLFGALAVALIGAIPASGLAADKVALHEQIDRLIADGWKARNIKPAEACSDAEFLRRAYLDLAGTIPTTGDARVFLDDPSPSKRLKLIDSLLAGPGYAPHMQQVFDVVFLERQYGANVTETEWEEYLRSSFAANKPWDQLVRELVGADGTDEKTRPATKFYMVRTIDSYRVLNPTHVTRDIGRLFLGVNLQCAQCHDHPVIRDYKQADYYGIKAFVDRLYMFSGKHNDKPVMFLAEKPEGEVSYHSAFDPKKKVHTGKPHMPGGNDLQDPTLPKGKEYKVAPANGVMPVPAYSRRAQLAKFLTSPDNVAFRRNAANRFWELIMGRGLVHPVDLNHAGNKPSHPELLDLLARHFAETRFDIKGLVRELVLTRTYQLSSIPPSPGAVPPPEAFAVAPLKPLRPAELAFAVMQAAGLLDAERLRLGAKADDKALQASLNSHVKPFVDSFARPPGHPESGFEASLFQALFLGNGAEVNGLLTPRPGNLIDRLSKLTDADRLAEEMYLSLFSRRPTKEEAAQVAAFLKDRAKDRPAALQEMAWAMLASAEFRFNH